LRQHLVNALQGRFFHCSHFITARHCRNAVSQAKALEARIAVRVEGFTSPKRANAGDGLA
jgi:hypothetical protein